MSKTFAIVPAAGRSRRMGRPKLLLPYRGTTVLEHLLSVWKSSRVDRIVVVSHPDDRDVHACCREMDVELVVPSVPPPEMKDSVAAGLALVRERFAPSTCDAWLLAPADMPRLSADVINRLIEEHATRSEESVILAPRHGGKRGHPVLFPWPLAAEVENLAIDEGVNAIVEGHDVREIACEDAGVLADLDTPEDYRRLQDD